MFFPLGSTENELALTQTQQAKRLRQLLLTVLIGFAISAVKNALIGRQSSVAVLLVSMAVLGYTWLMTNKGNVQQAATLFLSTLTVAFSIFMWLNEGLRDPSLLAYTGIMVLASMMVGLRVFWALFGFMLSWMAVIAVANLSGWHVNANIPFGVGQFVDLACILCATSVAAWIMSSELRGALKRLQGEIRRVHDSRIRMEHMAYHDQLTGLPNRLLARDRFEQAASRSRRSRQRFAMLYLDMDNFKTINDTLGHSVGDVFLQQASARLQATLRRSDTICRLGGDEYLLIVNDLRSAEEAAKTAQKILMEMASPYDISGQRLFSSCSIGIAMFPDDGESFEALLQCADLALYSAKDDGRNACRFYSPDMNQAAAEHLALVSGLREAIDQGQFVLHYQPKIDLLSGEVVGAEALVRWQHPEKGLIPPNRFIAAAEKSGLIIELGSWVLREACSQAAAWRQGSVGELCMAVNLSPVQCLRDNVERQVLDVLAATGLPPSQLELELTESMLITDSDQLSSMLKRLRVLGVQLSIDDFGTGYSNLGYIKQFEVKQLKIDQSFVRRLTVNEQDRAIVRAIVQMTEGLEILSVAEGVEDEATLHRLIEFGCNRGQGYFWSKPVPAEDFEAFVRAHRHLRPAVVGHRAGK
jgi:diguanylate cyclase (GGDEF)-like protein